jgi:hypothetical protein
MSTDDPLLDREAIAEAFRRLGDRLARDIDAVFRPHGVVVEEAWAVADELGWPRWWLNEQASAYVAPGGDPSAPRVFDHPGLRVSAASPEHLLAMKVLAARRRDAEDIRFLVKHLNMATAEEARLQCAEIFPGEEVPERARLVLEDAFGDRQPAWELAKRALIGSPARLTSRLVT